MQDVIERAGVSRPTFYEHFANKEDCFLAAFDTSAQRLCANGSRRPSSSGGDVWRDRLRLGLEALLQLRLHRAGDRADADRRGAGRQRRRRCAAAVELLDGFARLPRRRRPASSSPPPPSSPITAAGVVGGVESLLYARLCKGEYDELASLLPSLMYFVVLPYEGHEAAGEELAVGAS